MLETEECESLSVTQDTNVGQTCEVQYRNKLCVCVYAHDSASTQRLVNGALGGCSQHPVSAKGESKFDNIQICMLVWVLDESSYTHGKHTRSLNINKQPWRITASQR